MRWLRGVASSLIVAMPAIGLAGAAQADGYAPRAAYVAPSNWTGIYAGINAGWMWSDYDWAFAPPIGGAAHQAYSMSTDNGFVGVHGGYQHQFGVIVVGVEGSYQLGHGEFAREAGFGNNPCCDSLVRMRSLATVGPRVGFAQSNWMVYATGGWAFADIESKGLTVPGGAAFFPARADHSGWFIGGGVELLVGKNAFIGVEYKHISMETERHCAGPPIGTCLGAAGAFVDRDISADADVVTARLSFKWGRDDRLGPLK